MTVYVDDMMLQASVPNGARKVTSKWSHLMADSHEELVAFAKSIGLRESWIQHAHTPQEHFDVTVSRREAALNAGAVPVPIRSQEWMDLQERSRARFVRICDPERGGCSRPVSVTADLTRMVHLDSQDALRCEEALAGPWRYRSAYGLPLEGARPN